MTRTWMIDANMSDRTYKDGLAEFYEFVSNNLKGSSSIACPCERCGNISYMAFPDVKIHLEKWRFSRSYTLWIFHGESLEEENNSEEDDVEVHERLTDDPEFAEFFELEELEVEKLNVGSIDNEENDDESIAFEDVGDDTSNWDDLNNMYEKLCESEAPLYPGCKFTKMSAVVKLYNIKGANGVSDTCFTSFLALIKELLPDGNVLPVKTYEAKKLIRGVGMKYEKIHACPNDCILYRKLYQNLTNCPKCLEWRYKDKEGIPAKVLWYFPLIPRVIRIYANPDDAKMLTWHETGRINDGKLRHPADGKQWKSFDAKYPEFGNEPRNLRLALSTDGMNPHGNMSSQHSTWPVVLAIYNLPPYVCMKRKYLMLSLLISGPKQPGNDIDVYLEPLLDDLRLLWDSGIEVFDAYKNETFNLRAMLLCTITDYPAYGDLSGHTVHGKEACPLCGEDIESEYLKSSRKYVYMGNRRFLYHDHCYRKMQKAFNGRQELRQPPRILSGHEVYQKVKHIEIDYGKKSGSKLSTRGYKKRSIFFDKLPYWPDLEVRHCLDFMHIEKNVCDNIINTLLNVPGKTKDNAAAREDMKMMGIRLELAPQKRGNRTFLPPAAYTLSRNEKKELCACLNGIKVPHGYSSNIKSLVSMQDLKLTGLKSHDCHTLMQQLLPVAIRSILPEKVRYAITRFCLFFQSICEKVIDPDDADSLQDLVVTSLCQLEMYFPPSFFTIMIHLTIHLVREILYLGPVYLRYQYPFERLMKVYKDYTSNRYRPEGCIAERAILDEALSYCYAHLSPEELIGVPKNRHSDWMTGKGIRGRVEKIVTREMLHLAHMYVLNNEDEVQPYIQQHKDELKYDHQNKTEKWIANEHTKTFPEWFRHIVLQCTDQTGDDISPRLLRLGLGPNARVTFYNSFAINGYTFYTREQDEVSTMQNSGVSSEFEAMHFATSKDKKPIWGKCLYYGVIQEILVLDYIDFTMPLFRCNWVDNNIHCVRKDKMGFTLVNLGKVGNNKDDPFIMASQAKQVFYVTDPMDKKWSVVLSIRSRRSSPSDNGDDDQDVVFEGMDQSTTVSYFDDVDTDHEDTESIYMRDDHGEGIWVNEETMTSKKRPRS